MVAVLAVGGACLGCFFDSLSLVIWRLTALPAYNTTRVITLGFIFQVISMLVDTLSLAYLTEFTHSVVDSFSVISVLLVSRCLLGEVPSGLDVAGAVLVVIGIVLCISTRPYVGDDIVYSDALASYGKIAVLGWFAGFACTVATLVCAMVPCGLHRGLALAAGMTGALAETLAKLMTLALGANRMEDWVTIILIILVYVFCELYIIRLSLSVNPAYVHQPVFYATWALGSITSGGLVYGDFNVYTGHYLELALTIVGVGLVLFGCVLPMVLQPSPPNNGRLELRHVSLALRSIASGPNPQDVFELETLNRSF